MTATKAYPDEGQESSGESRTSTERREWALAGEHASGLERSRVALRLAVARADHAAAEGASYV
jgi:hypothetical protein